MPDPRLCQRFFRTGGAFPKLTGEGMAVPDTVLVVQNPAASWKLPFSAAEFSLLLHAMLHRAGFGEAGVELTLLADPAMERLNMDAMGCEGPTNILSFPASRAPVAHATPGSPPLFLPHHFRAPETHGQTGNGDAFLGWLALSADTLLRESFLYGQETEEHCIRLLAHGLAHLMGLNHGPEMDALAREMENAAREARRMASGS